MKGMNHMNGNGFIANDPFTERIIGLAIRVHAEPGSGFLEPVYHRALMIELEDAGIRFATQVPLQVSYKGRPAGSYIADLIVEERLLIELKVCEFIQRVHEVQIVNYLKATGIDLGLILNFGSSSLQIKRKQREYQSGPSGMRLQEV
jgi:GxxExxY protein